MLFKGKLLVSIASIGVAGGAGAGIYYSKIKNENAEKDDVAGNKGSPVAIPANVKGDASPDSAQTPVPVPGDVPEVGSADVVPTETENPPPTPPADDTNGKTASEESTPKVADTAAA